MSSNNEIIRHEQSTLIVHTIVIGGEAYEQIKEAKTTITSDKEQNKTRTTSFEKIKKIGKKLQTIFRETRTDGKVKSAVSETTMAAKEKDEFEKKWSKNWQPQIREEEVFQMSSKPLDHMDKISPIKTKH